LDLHRVMVREGIVLGGGKFCGDDPLPVFIDLIQGGRDLGEGRYRVVFGEAAVLSVFFQMCAVGGRVGDIPRGVDGRLIIKVHTVNAHIAVFINVTDQSL